MYDYYEEDRYQEDRCATVPEAIAEYALNVGHEVPDRAWLLSDYDVWVRNPWYSGPSMPHPEDVQ